MDNINRTTMALNINLYAKQRVSPQITAQQPSIQNVSLPNSHVSISEQGKDKINQENKQINKTELGESIAKQLYDNAQHGVDKKEDETSQDPTDRMIAKLKEQIAETQKELQKLSDDESEQAVEQKKILQNKIIDLNGQLLSLMEKKLKKSKTT